MKKTLLFLSIVSLSIILKAQPPEGPADKGMTFGIATKEEGALTGEQLITAVKSQSTAEVKVKGKVIEVCKAEGCWLKLETATGIVMMRMKDHAFMVPLAMNGKTIVAQGTAALKETSVGMLRHYAEDAGKTEKEISAIKEPKTEITMQATGILVL